MIALTDHLLLLTDDAWHLWEILQSLDTYCENVLLIRAYEEEARNTDYWRRNVGDMEFWAEKQRRREIDWAKPPSASPKESNDARSLARALWEEAPLLAEEHSVAEENRRAE